MCVERESSTRKQPGKGHAAADYLLAISVRAGAVRARLCLLERAMNGEGAEPYEHRALRTA